MIFKYPYTDLYNLNLDWVIQAIKEVQETITNLGTVVNTFNGQSGDVTLSAADITSIVGGIVNSFNGRSGDVTLSVADIMSVVGGIVNSFNGRSGAVTLTEADVNATLIDIVWTSDPGEVIGDLSQSALDELFAAGRRVLIFNNALGEPDRIYFLTLVGDVVTPQQYIPTGAIAGVASVNGQTGAVTVRGDTIPVSGTDQTTVEDALAAKEDVLTFDQTPTAGSTNPVTSAGIQAADAAIQTDLSTLSNTVSGIDNRLEAAEQALTYAENDITTLEDEKATYSNLTTYVETEDTASQTIPANTFFIWKGVLYKTQTAIAQGVTIATVSDKIDIESTLKGALNAINEITSVQTANITMSVTAYNTPQVVKSNNMCYVEIELNSQTPANQNVTVGTIPAGFRPFFRCINVAPVDNGAGTIIGTAIITIAADGTITANAEINGFVGIYVTYSIGG